MKEEVEEEVEAAAAAVLVVGAVLAVMLELVVVWALGRSDPGLKLPAWWCGRWGWGRSALAGVERRGRAAGMLALPMAG